MIRTIVAWTVVVVGIAALVYALIPPIKPQYLSAAGSLLGLGPVAMSAIDGNDRKAKATT